MAGRPKIFDENVVVEKATSVFLDKCYDATSADELLAAMGIGKGSFYLAFQGGKQELYQRSLQQFSDRFSGKLETAIANAPNGIDVIKSYFYAIAEGNKATKYRGCYLGNALVQLSEKDNSTREIAARLLGRLQEIFTAAVRKAQAAGQLKTTADPELIGLHLCNFWNGIHVTKRMGKSPKALRALVDLNLQILS
ncbi:transcriptional regulator, TetR family [Chitinophaga terrae (ex Kim and Jung 2007)]|uniref:Transcriptional regulator, TetR family n=1 Tax=Chitinophaga terrae (ex Kim and Jung 2007) TaxID=408074 RepID=A0A1H4D229_9BACT|nr:TetR family transcriptional regulator C-terminal domain-containing protein [Chitinophaga terrae (ex Kim and Jung 2007)]MDQ0108438.1 TetR/AcrR family transcriptional repressor of nem operon [Chitinophaga terrae (ex Kim and Jung 2007)]GEP90609.1 TetR family transcriptional regulator [Chitinophaga terrae (ex Kim and Jung 2007)]SEA66641.1 transcriptional regulator, TetR family [Chitinophaga terrae (ex Kim and Jung 2007)]